MCFQNSEKRKDIRTRYKNKTKITNKEKNKNKTPLTYDRMQPKQETKTTTTHNKNRGEEPPHLSGHLTQRKSKKKSKNPKIQKKNQPQIHKTSQRGGFGAPKLVRILLWKKNSPWRERGKIRRRKEGKKVPLNFFSPERRSQKMEKEEGELEGGRTERETIVLTITEKALAALMKHKIKRGII